MNLVTKDGSLSAQLALVSGYHLVAQIFLNFSLRDLKTLSPTEGKRPMANIALSIEIIVMNV